MKTHSPIAGLHRRALGLAAATAAAASVLVAIPGAGPASAAGINCTGLSSHQNNAGARATIRAGKPARSGLYEECNDRFTGTKTVDLHCYQINGRGNYWWFVDDNAGQQGWVFEDNFSTTPARSARCAGAVQAPPS